MVHRGRREGRGGEGGGGKGSGKRGGGGKEKGKGRKEKERGEGKGREGVREGKEGRGRNDGMLTDTIRFRGNCWSRHEVNSHSHLIVFLCQ